MEGGKLEMRKGGEGEIIMPTCPESTKRTEYLLRLVKERQHWQPSLASELAASSNGRHIRSGWDIEMLAVGITQLVVIVGRRREGKRKRRGGRMKKGATIFLLEHKLCTSYLALIVVSFQYLLGTPIRWYSLAESYSAQPDDRFTISPCLGLYWYANSWE